MPRTRTRRPLAPAPQPVQQIAASTAGGKVDRDNGVQGYGKEGGMEGRGTCGVRGKNRAAKGRSAAKVSKVSKVSKMSSTSADVPTSNSADEPFHSSASGYKRPSTPFSVGCNGPPSATPPEVLSLLMPRCSVCGTGWRGSGSGTDCDGARGEGSAARVCAEWMLLPMPRCECPPTILARPVCSKVDAKLLPPVPRRRSRQALSNDGTNADEGTYGSYFFSHTFLKLCRPTMQ